MPVGPMGEPFDESLGRPTQERYSLAGLLLITEFRNWTNLETAEDLAWLVEPFRLDEQHHGRSTYQALRMVFEQQCEMVDDKVQVRVKKGGEIVCNPSKSDAKLSESIRQRVDDRHDQSQTSPLDSTASTRADEEVSGQVPLPKWKRGDKQSVQTGDGVGTVASARPAKGLPEPVSED